MRKSIQIEGFGHGNNPVPAASLHRGILVSGAIFGMNPATQRIAPGLETQCALMLQHAERILNAAQCQWDDVVKMNFFLAPDQSRELLNFHWLRLFPDALSRPARHVIVNDRLPPGTLVQCDLMAIAPGA